jgi:hypothetical protein
MSFLDFVRGPALAFAVTVFVLDTLWRLVGILPVPALPDLSPARAGSPSPVGAALHANLRAM